MSRRIAEGEDCRRADDDRLRVGDCIRTAIESTDDGTTNLPPTTISVGVAMLRDGMAASGLLAAADAALYRAKRAGRNKVCVAA